MAEPLTTTALAAFASQLAKLAVERSFQQKSNRAHREAGEKAIESHLRYILSWATSFQVYGMPQPSDVASSIIALTLTNLPRRYRPGGRFGVDEVNSSSTSEMALLDLGDHCLLLGDPGSGKTTSLKRIALHFSSDLIRGSKHVEGTPGIPILLVCRDHVWRAAVTKQADAEIALGAERDQAGSNLIPLLHDVCGLTTPLSQQSNARVADVEATARYLDGLRATLLVDGLDEIPLEHRRGVVADLQFLSRHLDKSRIIASSRGGAVKQIEGFSEFDILPLTSGQVTELVRARLRPPRFGVARLLKLGGR